MKLDITEQSAQEVAKERKQRAARYRAFVIKNYRHIGREVLLSMFKSELVAIHFEATGGRM